MSIDDSSHRRVRARVRFLAAGFALCGLLFAASAGKAADWPQDVPLRGSFPAGPIRWDGINFGAHAGVTVMDTDFGNGPTSLIGHILRESTVEAEFAPSGWATLPSDLSNSASYGGFLGYNLQWDQLVVGVDIGYSHMTSRQTNATDGLTRIVTTSDNVEHVVSLAAQSSLKLIDYGTVRGRAGYAIDQFLPYAMLGVAVGRFNYSTTATVLDVWTPAGGPPVTFGPFTEGKAKDNAFAAGFLAGLGLDVAILPNVFLRGEWEFIAFGSVGGIRNNINTARAGVGVRF